MFEREKENLTGIQNLNNRHLIKHIATCQQNTDYYVVFPFANGGNLLEYWEREIEIPRSLDLIMWSLQQMLGLAGALYTLHHDLGADIHCRHGDIKPANILLFEKGDDRILVLADLGVSRFHEERTHMRRGGTTTMATTLSYEAPEVLELGNKDKPRARTYDIWSLGCVFLEFVIFLLYDFKAVKNFEDNRKRTTTCDNPNASFFQTTSNGHAEILPEVFDAIEALREDPRCRGGTSLNVLVNLIADKLLVTVVENRWRAEQLHEELQKIVHKANQDRSYLLNTTDQSPPVPKVFLPVGAQASRTW
jgi:serine/threonine protein kinase